MSDIPTLFVNLFGFPSAGKSTTAAGLFYRLKCESRNVELISEYAKDKAWANDTFSLGCQPYIAGKQIYRQYRVNGKVDIAITDSPIILSIIYGKGNPLCSYSWEQGVVSQFETFNNLNFLLTELENKSFNPNGRFQKTLEEAKQVHPEIVNLLEEYDIDYYTVDTETQEQRTEFILSKIKEYLKLV